MYTRGDNTGYCLYIKMSNHALASTTLIFVSHTQCILEDMRQIDVITTTVNCIRMTFYAIFDTVYLNLKSVHKLGLLIVLPAPLNYVFHVI